VPLLVGSVGATELSLGVGSGEAGVVGPTEVVGFGLPTPGPGFDRVLVGVGLGPADLPGAAGSAEAAADAPLLCAEGVEPSLAVGNDPAGASPAPVPVPEGRAEWAGREVGST
jgi:hypothetical protein